MASPSSSSRVGNEHGIQLDDDDDCIYYELEPCVASLDQLFLDPNDPKKYKGPMPHHIDALLQLASGLEHIHSQNLVHGDIKPENVLICLESAGQDEITLKWANFGLNRNVSERGRGKTNQVGGNNTWLSPELLSLKLNSNVEENNYKETVKSDVFAQGLVFGSLFLNGEHLYGSMEKENEIPQNIIEGNPINMQKIDGKLRVCYENDLLKKMLEHDPDKRITSTQVVNQLKVIKEKIAGKEKELLELCGRDSRSDLTEKIRNLIQFGINLNAKDDGGRNALHLLCRSYSSPKLTDAIKLLIENKIDFNAKDKDGLNAIHFLCRYHSNENLIDAIQILIKSGIDTKATTKDGSNALHYLCRYNSSRNLTDAVGIFTELGMNLMEKDGNGWSAFYYLQNKDKKEMKIWFDRDAKLGRGGFGAVFKGKFGGREVAVKRVEVHRSNKREEEAMLKLEHPNIVKLLHCESDEDFRYYALELCDASLDKLFLDPDNPQKYKGPMPRHNEVFHQLADGLAYIHAENLIHRDIKPDNVLISVRSTGQGKEVTIKWADFGLSKSVNERGTFPLSGIKGTKIWFAPESVRLLRQPEKEEDTYRGTVKSDVFAQGLVFGFLLLNGKHLYGCGEKEIHDNLIEKKPVNMKNMNEKLRQFYENDLLRKMLEDDPQKRITSKQVVEQLKFINGNYTCPLYFDPRADEPDIGGHWITGEELNKKLLKLMDMEEEIQHAYLYSNPLSSKQWTNGKLYHAFVVIQTLNWWWSIEKNMERITIQRSRDIESVRDMYQRKKRTTGPSPWTWIRKIKTTQGRNTTINELINYIWRKDCVTNVYHVLSANYQIFAALVFDRIRSPHNDLMYFDEAADQPPFGGKIV